MNHNYLSPIDSGATTIKAPSEGQNQIGASRQVLISKVQIITPNIDNKQTLSSLPMLIEGDDPLRNKYSNQVMQKPNPLPVSRQEVISSSSSQQSLFNRNFSAENNNLLNQQPKYYQTQSLTRRDQLEQNILDIPKANNTLDFTIEVNELDEIEQLSQDIKFAEKLQTLRDAPIEVKQLASKFLNDQAQREKEDSTSIFENDLKRKLHFIKYNKGLQSQTKKLELQMSQSLIGKKQRIEQTIKQENRLAKKQNMSIQKSMFSKKIDQPLRFNEIVLQDQSSLFQNEKLILTQDMEDNDYINQSASDKQKFLGGVLKSYQSAGSLRKLSEPLIISESQHLAPIKFLDNKFNRTKTTLFQRNAEQGPVKTQASFQQKDVYGNNSEEIRHSSTDSTRNKQLLPSILMKDLISMNARTERNIEKQREGQANFLRSSVKKFRNMIKPDVSYLKDSINFNGVQRMMATPSMVTSGDRGRDEILEVTLNDTQIGRSLIDLPTSISDLENLITESIGIRNQQFQSSGQLSKLSKQEQLLDQKLNDRFSEEQRGIIRNNLNSKKIKERVSKSLLSNLASPQLNRKANIYNEGQQPLSKMKFIKTDIIEQHGTKTLLSEKQNDSAFGPIIQTTEHSASLGLPSARQDTLMLINWFNQTTQALRSNQSLPALKKQSLIQVVFNLAIEEIIRQVSVSCIERGQVLRTIFDQYTSMVESMCLLFQDYRVQLKTELNQKVEKYMDFQEKTAQQNKKKLEGYWRQVELMKIDTQALQATLSQRNTLIEKLKKKCFDSQRDAEASMRKMRLIERENYELIQKCQEQCEKLQEPFVNPVDESERVRLMQIIEQEVIQEKDQLRMTRSLNFGSKDEQELDAGILNDVIQEESVGTDTQDFDAYLRASNLDFMRDIEMQTNIKTYAEAQTSTKMHKVGLMRDKDTMTDAKMLQSLLAQTPKLDSPSSNPQTPFMHRKSNFFSSVQLNLNPQRFQQSVERLDEIISEDSSLLYGSEYLDGIDEAEENSLSEIKEDQDDETSQACKSEDGDQLRTNEGVRFEKASKTIQISQKPKGKHSKRRAQNEEDKLQNKDSNTIEAFDYEEEDDIGFEESKNNDQASNSKTFRTKTQSSTNLLKNPLLSEINASKTPNMKSKKAMLKKKKTSIMEVYALQVKDRLKNLLSDQGFQELKKSDGKGEEVISKLITELKYASKEMQSISDEMEKQRKELKFQKKLVRRFEREIDEAHAQIDGLEMDNYTVREQYAETVKQFEEFKKHLEDIMIEIDSDKSIKLRPELKVKFSTLQEKMAKAFLKAVNVMSEEDMGNQSKEAGGSTLSLPKFNINDSVEIQENTEEDLMRLSQEFELLVNNSKEEEELEREAATKKNKTEEKKKALTKFKLFKIGKRRASKVKKLVTHPAQIIAKKLLSKDKKSFKDYMPRKMLLRIIFQIYGDRSFLDHLASFQQQQLQQKSQNLSSNVLPSLQLNQSEKNQSTGKTSFNPSLSQLQQPSLLEWLYDNFLQKYGLKNVSEKKFKQMIASCLIFKDILPRIRLFSRFIELHNELQPSDFAKYLEIVDILTAQILNFKIEDETEVTLLPLNKAIEIFKVRFDQKYLPKVLNSKLSHVYSLQPLNFDFQIEKMKLPVSYEDQKRQKHLKGVKEALDMDEFLEFVLDCFQALQEEKEQSIRDVYLAVDVNNDGFLSYLEFKMLMKLFHGKTSKEIWGLFEEYGKTNIDPNNPIVKYLNLESFIQMALDKDLFDYKTQQLFQNSTNLQKDFEWLQKELPSLLGILRTRLLLVDMREDFEMLELLEDFQSCVRYPFSQRVAWLCYRLVDEQVKRVFLERMAKSFMPVDLKQMGIKVRPTQLLIGASSDIFYSTSRVQSQ